MIKIMQFVTKSKDETFKKGKEFAEILGGGEVVCLYGDLGAGKTVFVSGIIDYFDPGKRVRSPTFIIVRHYPISFKDLKELIHVDLYRLEKKHEIEQIGLSQYMHRPDSIILIEWADKLGTLVPKKRTDIYISQKENDVRVIEIKKYG